MGPDRGNDSLEVTSHSLGASPQKSTWNVTFPAESGPQREKAAVCEQVRDVFGLLRVVRRDTDV